MSTSHSIIYEAPASSNDVISLEQYAKIRARRRKRYARRMVKRYPLFAFDIVKERYQEYTKDQFQSDIAHMKPSKKMKGKSPVNRQGRYSLYSRAISMYRSTGELKYLEEAQTWRDKMFKPYRILYSLKGEKEEHTYPSTVDVNVIIDLSKIKFSSWEELDSKIKVRLKYVFI